jgi:hypothetical protein
MHAHLQTTTSTSLQPGRPLTAAHFLYAHPSRWVDFQTIWAKCVTLTLPLPLPVAYEYAPVDTCDPGEGGGGGGGIADRRGSCVSVWKEGRSDF